MKVDVTINTDAAEWEIQLETTPNTPIKDVVAEACDDAGVDVRELTSYQIVGVVRSGELV